MDALRFGRQAKGAALLHVARGPRLSLCGVPLVSWAGEFQNGRPLCVECGRRLAAEGRPGSAAGATKQGAVNDDVRQGAAGAAPAAAAGAA
jgi:hypothetical protein